MQPELTEKQQEVMDAYDAGKKVILTGGALSTGKSYGMALPFLSAAFSYPGTHYAVARRLRNSLKATIINTFLKTADQMGMSTKFRYHSQELTFTFKNKSVIRFIGLDEARKMDYTPLRGLELTWAAIDECDEVEKEAFMTLRGRVGRQNVVRLGNEDIMIPSLILLSCNPTNGWVKQDFYDPYKKGTLPIDRAVILSKPHDNPYNTDEYIETLDAQEHENFFWWKRFVDGDWEYQPPDGALWDAEDIVYGVMPDSFDDVWVGVDPAVSDKETSDETGIVVVGVEWNATPDTKGAFANNYWVLEDHSGRHNTLQLGNICEDIYKRWGAKFHVETNAGGMFLQNMLERRSIPHQGKYATKSKEFRAQPAVELYKHKKVFHVQRFNALEAQMLSWDPMDKSKIKKQKSPDRIDALVYALTGAAKLKKRTSFLRGAF